MMYAKERFLASTRATALTAAICGCLAVTACGGSNPVDSVAQSVAKASYSPFNVTIQPGQSAASLTLNAGETEPRFALTLPVGSTAVKIEAAGGTGSPVLTLSPDADFSTSTLEFKCVSARTCQWAFPALTQPKAVYIQVGTRSSYSNVTLNTYVGPQPNKVIPLNTGEPMSGLSGPVATDVFFTFNVPAGASQLNATLSEGNGGGQLVVNESLTDFSGMYAEPANTITRTVVAGKTYYFFPMASATGGSYSNYTLTGYAQ
ncbi:hypothetical protein [Paraburkholderia dinghuensis]|uniref:Peptidase C-terminal archaeal/bacterial domain-containing protein n=1 Tax=Paraburkholderia dinghuensis TaxID=2305225 RepID=A0A3N6P2U5_9BURK|nr:hypothetical protein [Paraburkholderia dinghuensis]RQH07763.1 hypothetical protein D1Y85_06520 [Paraburkholderia dinghuensis]